MPALATPLNAAGPFLPDSFRAIIDYALQGDLHGLFVIGSTGEAYALNLEKKKHMMECAIEHNNGRVPFYIGVGDITTHDSFQLAQTAKAAGANALSVVTTFFIMPSYEKLKQHFLAIEAAVNIPVVLYNNAPRTNVDLPPRMIEELSAVDNIVGIKDNSGDIWLRYRTRIMSL